jgi:hypothetical protein
VAVRAFTDNYVAWRYGAPDATQGAGSQASTVGRLRKALRELGQSLRRS